MPGQAEGEILRRREMFSQSHMTGSNDLSNWARCVISVQSVGASFKYLRLTLGKRGGSMGLLDVNGEPTRVAYLKQSDDPKVVLWTQCPELEAREAASSQSQDAVLALISEASQISQGKLLEKAKALGLSRDKAKSILRSLEDMQLARSSTKADVRGKPVYWERAAQLDELGEVRRT